MSDDAIQAEAERLTCKFFNCDLTDGEHRGLWAEHSLLEDIFAASLREAEQRGRDSMYYHECSWIETCRQAEEERDAALAERDAAIKNCDYLADAYQRGLAEGRKEMERQRDAATDAAVSMEAKLFRARNEGREEGARSEREACAKIAESVEGFGSANGSIAANVIRARSEVE